MIKTNPLAVKDIADIARRVREDYKIKNGDCFPILEYINHLFDNGIIGIMILENNDPYLDKNTPAVYNAMDNFIYLKESVIDEIECGNYRNLSLDAAKKECEQYLKVLQAQTNMEFSYPKEN